MPDDKESDCEVHTFPEEIRSIEKAIETGEIINLQQVQQRISNFLDGLCPEVGFFQEIVDKLFIDGVIEISIELPDGEPVYVLVAVESLEREIRMKLMDLQNELFYDSECSIEFVDLEIDHYLFEQYNIHRCEIGNDLWNESQNDVDKYPVYFEHVDNCNECPVSTLIKEKISKTHEGEIDG